MKQLENFPFMNSGVSFIVSVCWIWIQSDAEIPVYLKRDYKSKPLEHKGKFLIIFQIWDLHMARIHRLIPPRWCSLIILIVSAFSCLITGVFGSVSAEAAAAMAMNKYKSNRSGGCERDRWRREGGRRWVRGALRAAGECVCVSGQVDWGLERSCQTQDLCQRVWKVPVCLLALYSLTLPLFFLYIVFSSWRWCEQVMAALFAGSRAIFQSGKIKGLSEPGPNLHHFILYSARLQNTRITMSFTKWNKRIRF